MTKLVHSSVWYRLDLPGIGMGLLIALLFAGCASAGSADSAASELTSPAIEQSFRTVSVREDLIQDLQLIDETGQQRQVYQDLVKDRIVVLNFIFTTCSTICMPMGAMYSSLQSEFGDRPIRLISISIDPERDTPSRLSAWKNKFRGGPNWTLLTGSKRDIDALGKRLGVYASDRLNHVPTLVLIDDLRGRSTRMGALVQASAVITAIDLLAGASPEPGAAANPSASPVDIAQSQEGKAR
jgi:protein SCO1